MSALAAVTGASGWLGQSLVRTLATKVDRVRCLVPTDADAATVRAAAPDAEIVTGDVRDPVAVGSLLAGTEGASVFHCAGVIHPAGKTRDFFDVNVGGTSLVMDHARRANARRVTYVSSNSPFGYKRSPDDVFDEDSPYNPHLGYGTSKMRAEQLLFTAAARGGTEAVIVRAPWFYGPNQPERQTRFFRAIKRGTFPLFGDGSNRRSMAYVDNLVQGLLLADERGENGKAYWIADARSCTMAEVHEAVRNALEAEGVETSRRQLKLPGLLCEVAARADNAAQKAGRYVQAVHVLSEMNKTIACTIDRARAELGYEPEVDLDEGMRRSVRWCIEQGIEL